MIQSPPGMGLTEAAPPPTVTIVSDVLLFREGLQASLLRDGRLATRDVVAGADALASICREPPDVVLLDGAMPNCLELARKMRVTIPGVIIVGFGISGGAERFIDCAESGLAAFVGCDGNISDVVTAVTGALNGELACSPRVSALMCERLGRLAGGMARSATLTRREGEIATLIGQGLSNKEIANDLNIGPSTVKNHVHSILEKLNVRRRSAIVQHLCLDTRAQG
jgi:two-component system, NarL family, nitrate/nitrite response regulator NarL